MPNLQTDSSKKLPTVGVKNCEKFGDDLNGWSLSKKNALGIYLLIVKISWLEPLHSRELINRLDAIWNANTFLIFS